MGQIKQPLKKHFLNLNMSFWNIYIIKAVKIPKTAIYETIFLFIPFRIFNSFGVFE